MKKIILVEDDDPTRDALEMALRTTGLTLINFKNGYQLINTRIDAPDLFLLDNLLPGLTGIELCRFIKRDKRLRHIPVIIMSAAVDFEKQARAAGAVEVIPKPFSLKELREIVAKFTQSMPSLEPSKQPDKFL